MIVEERPEDGIGETVVVTVGEVVGEVDGVAVEGVEEVFVYLFAVFHGDLRGTGDGISLR